MCLKLTPTLKPVVPCDAEAAEDETNEQLEKKQENDSTSHVKKLEAPSKIKKLCRFFIYKKCKYGAKGKGCHFYNQATL